MKKSEQKEPKLRQESLFPPSLFGIYLGVLLSDGRHSYRAHCFGK